MIKIMVNKVRLLDDDGNHLATLPSSSARAQEFWAKFVTQDACDKQRILEQGIRQGKFEIKQKLTDRMKAIIASVQSL